MKILKVRLIVFGLYLMLLPIRFILDQSTRPYNRSMLDFHLAQLASTAEAPQAKEWIHGGYTAYSGRLDSIFTEYCIVAALGFCILCAGFYLVLWRKQSNEKGA